MLNTYDVYLKGYGHYKVDASIYKIPMANDLECEVELISVSKFDDFLEDYAKHEASDEELNLIEREVAVQFFNNLH
jgi:hypothetical protein